MRRAAVFAGTRAGAVLAILTILLAIFGLSPQLSWVPEVPLLTVAALVPAAVLPFTGFRVALVSRSILLGLLAGVIAGTIGGGVGGLAYVAFGKPLLNIAAGLALGAVGGAVLGSLGAIVAVRRPR